VVRTNVETTRRVFEAFAQRGEPSVRQQVVAELWHEDARWYPLMLGGGTLEGAVYEGHEGILKFFGEQADESFSEVSVELLELRDLDERRVLAHTRLSAVGKRSGASVVADTWVLVTLRDEKVLEGRAFADEAGALAHDRKRMSPD
jgi:ketosteroid isomerase-like protein